MPNERDDLMTQDEPLAFKRLHLRGSKMTAAKKTHLHL
jgi:hypothetical protein